MQVVSKDTDCLTESMTFVRQSSKFEGLSASQDFERVDSPNQSGDFSNIKSVLIPHRSAEDLYAHLRRDETYIERLHNFGTNMKYRIGTIKNMATQPNGRKLHEAYLLGKRYEIFLKEKEDENDPLDDPLEELTTEFKKILWFSYRHNYPQLLHDTNAKVGSHVSDTGWGCMIRACQMAFAECLKRTIRYREGLRQGADEKIVGWFLDSEIDPTKAPYSIQTLSKCMYEKFDLLPGTWLKPSAVLMGLDQIQQKYGINAVPDLQVEVFLEGTIYINNVLKKATQDVVMNERPQDTPIHTLEKEFEVIEDEQKKKDNFYNEWKLKVNKFDKSGKIVEKNKVETAKDLLTESMIDCAGDEGMKDMDNMISKKWKSSMMIVVLAKLGLDHPNPEYLPFIKKLLTIEESIGMIGGKPGLAYYIVGYTQDKLIYLDPHYVQEAVQSKKTLSCQMDTYYSKHIRYLNIKDIDTSVAMSFFIRDQDHFRRFIKKFKEICKSEESFLGIEVCLPHEELEDFESVDEEDEFEMINYKSSMNGLDKPEPKEQEPQN